MKIVELLAAIKQSIEADIDDTVSDLSQADFDHIRFIINSELDRLMPESTRR